MASSALRHTHGASREDGQTDGRTTDGRNAEPRGCDNWIETELSAPNAGTTSPLRLRISLTRRSHWTAFVYERRRRDIADAKCYMLYIRNKRARCWDISEYDESVEPRKLQSYSIEAHQIYIGCRRIIAAVKALICISVLQRFSECQSDKWRWVGWFAPSTRTLVHQWECNSRVTEVHQICTRCSTIILTLNACI